MKKIYLIGLSILMLSSSAMAQGSAQSCGQTSMYLVWTGEENDDFFNEANWREVNQKPSAPIPPGKTVGEESGSAKPFCLPGANKSPYQICQGELDLSKDKNPKAGTLEPGKPISFNLWIEDANLQIPQSISFICPEIGMTILNSQIELNAPTGQGIITLDQESTLTVQKNGGLGIQTILNFLDLTSWIILEGVEPNQFLADLTDKIWVQHAPGTIQSDYRINQYYQEGTLIRPFSDNYAALTIYAGVNQNGNSTAIHEDEIYSGSGIPDGMNDQTASFILKRGYMATFAVAANGTSKSKVYIASTSDLVINELPAALQNNVSFIRVVPWNWVVKKGTGGFRPEVNAGWFYQWNNTNNSRPNYEYVPMAWGAGGASPAALNSVINKDNVNHLLGFNESDNCNDQSGQFNNLCKPEVAVGYYENLMKTGMRLGTPAPRENGPTTWLLEFAQLAKSRDVRFDFVAVHWYDWGSNPANTPNADPQAIFNRFKNYLENVHRIYGLPIWITEFNANPNRTNSIQAEFLKLALPYLESLDYVERYAYFEPMASNSSNPVEPANLTDGNGNLTNIGEIYRNHPSTPSIPEATFESDGNLMGINDPFTPSTPEILSFEAECSLYLGNKWEVKEDENASNGKFIQGNNSLEGDSPLANQFHYELDLTEAQTFKIWIKAATNGGTGIRVKINEGEFETIGGLNSSEFAWIQLPRFYSFNKGKHRISFQFTNQALKLDQIAFISNSDEVDLEPNPENSCMVSPNPWGLTLTNVIYYLEAESGIFGSSWKVENNADAIGGEYLETNATRSFINSPPNTDGQVVYNFELEEQDQYRIWAKIQSLDEEENSLWIKVDDDQFRKWDNLQNDAFEWYWKPFHFSEGGEDKNLPFFLTEGTHTITIAYATQTFKIDRLAIASEGKNPAEEDPDVIRVFGAMDYEAENAELVGNAIIVNCAQSSNGQQVNFRTGFDSGIKFNQVIAPVNGEYLLTVHYMSAVDRRFRIFVNGEALGYQPVSRSGEWCFNNGSPSTYEVNVNLRKGVNTVEIYRTETDAPFIDKISFSKNPILLEAEEATLLGSPALVNCASASNGVLVNMGFQSSKAIIFEDIQIGPAGTYLLDITYLTAVNRSARVIINGETKFISFASTGAWCGGGGSTSTKTIEVELKDGSNQIELRPQTGEAPMFDKIKISEKPAETESLAARLLNSESNLDAAVTSQILSPSDFLVYPNPVKSQETVNINLPSMQEEGSFNISISDMYGRIWISENRIEANGQGIQLQGNLKPGLYLISIQYGSQIIQHRLLVE